MSFWDAVMAQPPLITYWVFWLTFITAASWVILLFSRQTRIDAIILFLVSVAVTVWMQWIHATDGFTRLLGLPHVVLWTPVLAYLAFRVTRYDIASPYRQVIIVLMASMAVSLVFDYIDVARYLLGDNDPITSA